MQSVLFIYLFSGEISHGHPCLIYTTYEFGFVPRSGGCKGRANPAVDVAHSCLKLSASCQIPDAEL